MIPALDILYSQADASLPLPATEEIINFDQLYAIYQKHILDEYDGEVRFLPRAQDASCHLENKEYALCYILTLILRIMREHGGYHHITVTPKQDTTTLSLSFTGEGGRADATRFLMERMYGVLSDIMQDASFVCRVSHNNRAFSVTLELPLYLGKIESLSAIARKTILLAITEAKEFSFENYAG